MMNLYQVKSFLRGIITVPIGGIIELIAVTPSTPSLPGQMQGILIVIGAAFMLLGSMMILEGLRK